MDLELAITSYQRLSPSVTSVCTFGPDGRVRILGRGDDCDWQLPDPSRVVSAAHAEIRFAGEHFLIRDTSTNGVFLNQSVEPVGKGAEVPLSEGDRLRIGDYEISVSVRSPVPRPAPGLPSAEPAGPMVAGHSLLAGGPGRPGGGLAGEAGASDVVSEVASETALAAGLGERFLGDSHVELPKPAIPDWNWGAEPPGAARVSSGPAGGDGLTALLEGLGLDPDQADSLSADQCRLLGRLTRTLLDRLLDLLHVRAQQKQELRVKQTLFQRSENNPLKFSATAGDALENLLLRPHSSFLEPEAAVHQAFDGVLVHEKALLKGVERVLDELLESGPAPGRRSLFARRRQLEALQQLRARQREDYGDIRRMLRSDTFVDAYEQAVSRSERE